METTGAMMSTAIRILQVAGVMNRGGAETMVMNLYRHIDREKVQFDFVTHFDRNGAFDDEIKKLGGIIYHCPQYRVWNHLQYVKWWDSFFRNHSEYRIIHSHVRSSASVYFRIAHRNGLKTIAHSHSTSNGRGVKARTKQMLQKSLERNSDYCLACGENAGKWLFPNKPFTVLNNAIDTQQYAFDPKVREAVRSELQLSDELTIGVVGSIKGVKNPMGVLDIFEAILRKNSAAKLLWIGDGDMRQAVEDRIKSDGIEDHVILTGVRSDVHRFLQAIDAFIMPSLWEGLPVAAIEAQAAGLQCFFSDRVSTETDLTGRCRFLPIEQPELWANAILSTDLLHTDTHQQIIDAGYDIHTTAKWLENFYLNLASNRR